MRPFLTKRAAQTKDVDTWADNNVIKSHKREPSKASMEVNQLINEANLCWS